MNNSGKKRILTAPICVLRLATQEEKELFFDKKEGFFYTFGLASGQWFVAHIPENEECYTFRPLRNLIPNMLEIKWEKTKDDADLGYTTICKVARGRLEEEDFLKEIFSPKPVPAPFLTKMVIQHYSYHPMLEKCQCLQRLHQQQTETMKRLWSIQEALKALLMPEKKEKLIQQKLRERRQNG